MYDFFPHIINTISISITCVSQEGLAPVESNQQVYDFYNIGYWFPLASNNSGIFSVSQGTEKLNKSHLTGKKPLQYQYGCLDVITLTLLSYPQFSIIIITRIVLQYIYENRLKQRLQKLWPERKEAFRSASLRVLFGFSKKLYKKTFPFSPHKITSILGTT